MNTLFFILIQLSISLLGIEMILKPRLDKAGGNLLLWYGVEERKYIVLWKI